MSFEGILLFFCVLIRLTVYFVRFSVNLFGFDLIGFNSGRSVETLENLVLFL